MAKQATVATVETAKFRVVARGNLNGARVRRVQNVHASDIGTAFELGEKVAEKMCAGLGNPFFNIYPPVGEKCNGQPSKGYAIENGVVVKVAVTA